MSSEPRVPESPPVRAAHAEARRAVAAALARGSLGRALLVTGEEGLGKEAFAAWIVQAALCPSGPARGEGSQPCEACSTCRKIAAGQHPDLARVARGDETLGSRHEITVAQVREGVVAFLGLRPFEAVARAVLVVRADELNEEAQNALLKTLEEPPGGSRLVLTSAREEALLDTVRSRCQVLRLLPLSDAELQALVPDADPAVVRLARGRPGRLAELRTWDLPALWALVDGVLTGRLAGSAFGRDIEALAEGDGDEEGDALTRRRLLLDLVRTRLRDLVLAASGGDAASALTPPPADAAAFPPAEVLLSADRVLLEAAEDLRRHLPGPVVWGALGRGLARAAAAARGASAEPGLSPN